MKKQKLLQISIKPKFRLEKGFENAIFTVSRIFLTFDRLNV